MTDTLIPELLASYEAALQVAKRSLNIARTLSEAHRSGLRPPEDVLDAYLARVHHDEQRLNELLGKVMPFRCRYGGVTGE